MYLRVSIPNFGGVVRMQCGVQKRHTVHITLSCFVFEKAGKWCLCFFLFSHKRYHGRRGPIGERGQRPPLYYHATLFAQFCMTIRLSQTMLTLKASEASSNARVSDMTLGTPWQGGEGDLCQKHCLEDGTPLAFGTSLFFLYIAYQREKRENGKKRPAPCFTGTTGL